ncbi:MAG TPA: efflux RND transporter periplasmic adaptor subunit [Terriglobales bacterium]|nr:efflux RND transporter periplasmic adaptor subunit [Terriglobales bacterium]
MSPNGRNTGFFARRRWILWAAGAVLAVILLASFASRDDAVPVFAATVARGNIRSVISTNGKVEPINNFEAHAPTGTTVSRILVKEGDHVKKGQLLVELDSATARSQAAQALAQIRASEADVNSIQQGGTQEEVLTLQAQLVKARADRDAAQRNYDALKNLQQSGAASPGEVRAAQAQLAAAEAQVKLLESKQSGRFSRPEISSVEARQVQAQSAYSAAEDILRQLVIRAPFDGVVYSLPVKQGAYVNPGDLILQEADLSKVLVRAYVDEPDIARLVPGQKIELTWDAVPGRTWTGAVNNIPASVKLHGTRNVGETTCVVPNPDFKLLPNINVGVTIVTKQDDSVLKVPREALRLEDGTPYVYLVANNQLERRDVQTSISNLTEAEITSGLQEGAKVALRSVNSKPLHDHLSVRVVQ